MRLIIGISGASGVIYGIRLLEFLARHPDIETHLILSKAACLTIALETDYTIKDLEKLATMQHSETDIGASIASGSFVTAGMIIAPCSMKTLSGIVNSYADNLMVRAADVVLKERRKLVVMPRETPLHAGHCRLLYEATQMGAIVAPPLPAFYNKPQSIDDIINHTIGRLLDLFDIDTNLVNRWNGAKKPRHLHRKS